MMSISHLIYPTPKGLNDNDQSFESEPGSMENIKKNDNFPAFSQQFKKFLLSLQKSLPTSLPDLNSLKLTWDDLTLQNLHKGLLNSCKHFNRTEFWFALQCAILFYFPGMALGIVYQYYELEQTQQQDQDEEIYDIFQEMQQPQPFSKQIKRLSEQYQSHSQLTSQDRMIQFVQAILRSIEQMMQTPQSMLTQLQYQQYCQDIKQSIQMQQGYYQSPCKLQSVQYQNHQCYYQTQQQQRGEQEMQCVQYHQLQQGQVQVQEWQAIIVIMRRSVISRATTNSTRNNENGGEVMITMVIKVRSQLPGEGGQVFIQF